MAKIAKYGTFDKILLVLSNVGWCGVCGSSAYLERCRFAAVWCGFATVQKWCVVTGSADVGSAEPNQCIIMQPRDYDP